MAFGAAARTVVSYLGGITRNQARRAYLRGIAETLADNLIGQIGFDETAWIAQSISERTLRTVEKMRRLKRLAARKENT